MESLIGHSVPFLNSEEVRKIKLTPVQFGLIRQFRHFSTDWDLEYDLK